MGGNSKIAIQVTYMKIFNYINFTNYHFLISTMVLCWVF